MSTYIIAIDQGTTGSTVLIFNKHGEICGRSYSEFTQHYPKPGWVEHDAEEIWQVTGNVIQQAMENAAITAKDIAAIGITNQRETTVVWDKITGKPIHNAIVWQCRRTSALCDQFKTEGKEQLFKQKTGLVLDAYFSGTKIKWLLDNVPQARQRAESGDLLFGTIDTWLLWKLTNGQVHATDYTNASRTLVYNIFEKKWDTDLLDILNIPANMLPEVHNSSYHFGTTHCDLLPAHIPIYGIAGDQQAALFGQNCWEPGMVKNTYGTGCFIVMNTGNEPIHSQNGLLTTLACNAKGEPCYALEGSVFIGGAVVQWMRDELGLIKNAGETGVIAESVDDTNGVYIVPAFVGLGAPYWNQNARGIITGLTRGSNRAHLIRAGLEAIAFQSMDVVSAMQQDAELPIQIMRADGGAAANNFLMQFQSDMLGVEIERPDIVETTAMGAAFLAGLGCGFWQNAEDLQFIRQVDKTFTPNISEHKRQQHVEGWHKAVKQTG